MTPAPQADRAPESDREPVAVPSEQALHEKLVESVFKQRALERELYGEARTEVPTEIPAQHYRIAAIEGKTAAELEATERSTSILEAEIAMRDQMRKDRRRMAVKALGALAFVAVSIGATAFIGFQRAGLTIITAALVLALGIAFFRNPPRDGFR